jgi:hypothetical protein
MRYAIGEIVLVVIGILIALQVNKWNELRKTQKQEIIFFNEILSDLEKDNSRLSYLEDYLHKRITTADTLLFYVRNPQKEMGLSKFGMYAEPLYYGEDAISYSTNFESAKASAAFTGFQQRELIKSLTQYYADFERLESNMSSIRLFIENRFEPLMAKISIGHLSTNSGKLVVTEESAMNFYQNVTGIKDNRKTQADYESVLRDPQFESYLVGDLGRSFNLLGKIKARQKRISEMEKGIKKFLFD